MKIRILELDALRGIAALAVVLYHFTLMLGNRQSLTGLNVGCMGVDMFFIISGFVIFMTVQKVTSWKSFVQGRFDRLYPTYWICVTFTTILVLLKTQSIFFTAQEYEWTNNLLAKYLANMTMFQYFLRLNDIDGSYWTLTIEIVFYALISLLLITKTINYIELIGGLILLVSLSYSLNAVSENAVMHKVLILLPLLKYFSLFYAGILLYKMKFEKITPHRIFLFVVTFVVQCSLFKNYYHNNESLSLSVYSEVLFVIYVIFSLFLLDSLGFIINPITQWLGKISYSLYAVHQYVGVSIIIPLLLSSFHVSFWFAVLISLLIVLALATLINKFIERPALKYLKMRQSHQLSRA